MSSRSAGVVCEGRVSVDGSGIVVMGVASVVGACPCSMSGVLVCADAPACVLGGGGTYAAVPPGVGDAAAGCVGVSE